jgi:ubiquinone/menaquinone biosynthesis C-methylase UbiE
MADSDPVRRYKKMVAGIYDRASSIFDQIGPRAFTQWAERLVEFAEIGPGARVLVVGSGRGAEVFPALERVGAEGFVAGVDLVASMAELLSADLREREITNAAVCRMDAEALGFADASFDFVLSSNVLFLCPQPIRALEEMHRVLAPSGRATVIPSGGASGFDPSLRRALREAYRPHLSESAAVKRLEEERRTLDAALQDHLESTHQPAIDIATEAGLREGLHSVGFAEISIVREEKEFFFDDEDQWWDWQWSHMRRSELEVLEPQILDALKSDVFERLQALKENDGIRVSGSTILALAVKN